jgi:elongator complex protein 3
MKKLHKRCLCIRCNEVKDNTKNIDKARLTCIKYSSSNGLEYFISFNTCSCKFCWRYFIYQIIYYILYILFGYILSWKGCPNDNTLYGFLRLRISNNSKKYFIELDNKGLIRELHVYGLVIPTYNKINKNSQHYGFGKKLLNEAERISKFSKCDGIAVISGIGVRNYYRKLGFTDNNHIGQYLIKYFNT